MITALLHRLVAIPKVYDFVQRAAGFRVVQRHIKEAIQPLRGADRVLDLGGGTGLYRDLWRTDCLYICLDNDETKLRGFHECHSDGLGILGDATRAPIRSGSLDVVMCTFVSHHIGDALLEQFIAEAMRMLKDDGHFVFVDGTWRRSRRLSRILWKYDRGSNPRTPSKLREVLSGHGTIQRQKSFAVFHEYLLCIIAKSPAVPPSVETETLSAKSSILDSSSSATAIAAHKAAKMKK